MREYICLVMAAILMNCAASAQQVWKVNCSGPPGAHFTDLPPAVAAASPGDTILVYGIAGSGCSSTYTAPHITKGLSIVGFLAGLTPGSNNPTQALLDGPLLISNIPANEQVVLSNIHIRHEVIPAPWGPGGVGSPIIITDCAGSVVLEDVTFRSLGTMGQDIRIERCNHVVLRGCTFWIGGEPIRVIDSNVLLTTFLTQIAQPYPFALPGIPYTTTTESLFLQRSTVTMVGSIVTGPGSLNGQPSRRAARLDNSTLRIGASSRLQGGILSGASSPPFVWDYTPAYEFITPAPSVVEKDPRAPAFNFFPSTPPTITPIDETFHDWVVADEWFDVRVIGPAGGFAFLAVSDMILPTPSPLGTLGLDPHSAAIIDVVPLQGPVGVHTWTFFCPSWIPNGYAFCLQSLTLSPNGVLGLTEPSPLVVAWDKDRVP